MAQRQEKLRPAPLLAGAAQVEITPPMGTQIAGDIGRYRPAELVLDPLYAKALVLQASGRKLCIVSLDLCIMTRRWADEIRRRAAEEFGFDRAAVMVHATQGHAAPSLGHCAVSDECKLIPPEYPWLRGGDDRYNPFAVERILKAIRQAIEALRPVVVGAASGIEGRVAFNRRFILRDGTARTHPPAGDPSILHVEGPIDPELGVVHFCTRSLQSVALLLHYTCHPTHGYPQRYITAGWPGTWSDGVKALRGPSCVPLVINGCCGNIHHRNHLDPSHDDSAPRLGRLLTESTAKVLHNVRYQGEAVLDWRDRMVKVPIRELDRKEVAAARKLIREHPEPIWLDREKTAVDWDWVYAAAMLDLAESRRRSPVFEYEVQAFRVGPIALAALMGEPFVEGQLRLKRQSPTYPTYVVHNTNGYIGYLPTPHALRAGGFETRTANWSKLVPEALDMVVDSSLGLLRQMFR